MSRFYFECETPDKLDLASKELRKLGRGHTIESETILSFATRPLGQSYDILEKYGFEEKHNDPN